MPIINKQVLLRAFAFMLCPRRLGSSHGANQKGEKPDERESGGCSRRDAPPFMLLMNTWFMPVSSGTFLNSVAKNGHYEASLHVDVEEQDDHGDEHDSPEEFIPCIDICSLIIFDRYNGKYRVKQVHGKTG